MASGTAQVHKSALSQDQDTVSIGEFPSVHLRFDVLTLDAWVVLEAEHVNFVVKVTNIADNGIVLHLGHVVHHDDACVSSCSHKYVGILHNVFQFLDVQAFHASLQGTDGVNFSDSDSGSLVLQGSSTTLADVSITADYSLLACNHHIGGSHDAVSD